MGAADVRHARRRAPIARHTRRRCAPGALHPQAGRLLAPGPHPVRPAVALLPLRRERPRLRRPAFGLGDQARAPDRRYRMTPDLRAKLDAFGRELTPELLGGTSQLFGQMFEGLDPQTIEEADLAYGPDERHRLDIYRREGAKGAPVFVFVHGGG